MREMNKKNFDKIGIVTKLGRIEESKLNFFFFVSSYSTFKIYELKQVIYKNGFLVHYIYTHNTCKEKRCSKWYRDHKCFFGDMGLN